MRNNTCHFDDLGLRAELLNAVKSKGYATPTPIQARVIPAILAGRDILVATPWRLLDLAKKMLTEPEYIEVTPGNTAAQSIAQKIHRVDKSHKRDLLIHLILQGCWRRVLVFVRTKFGANKLTEKKEKIPREEVSGFTIGGKVPDFVLLRPNNPSSVKKADKAILEIVNQRKILKQRGKIR